MLFPGRQPASKKFKKLEREPGMKCFHVCQPAGDLTDTMFLLAGYRLNKNFASQLKISLQNGYFVER